ncbi:MAG TPA: hypothetical protein VMZ71_03355 [Gemmataceae bacterium]|nr:hypothetical protein [Gemmataceae bacterium]
MRLGLGCAALAHVLAGCAPQPHTPPPQDSPTAGATTQLCPVIVRKPAGPPAIRTGTFDEKGNPVSVACATCHTNRPANPDAKLGKPLVMFHQGLVGAHGNLACASCHNPADGFASLRLADGKSVPYAEVMTLCAQCHGPQFRDYQHGAHGGMTGFWDLTKGGRARNNCVDCHDSHAPKYPTVTPARGPNDRFQTKGGHD